MFIEKTTGDSVVIKSDNGYISGVPTSVAGVVPPKNIYSSLAEEFPAEQIGQLKKGGASLDYISIAEAVHRMNTVVGVENWEFWIHDVIHDQREAAAIIVHVKVNATINGKTVHREAIGGHLIPDKGMEIGDAYKSAVSDALKKALTFFGIGLHLSRKEESLAYEQRQASQPDPVALATLADLKNRSKALNDEEKAMLRSMWQDRNGDLKVDAYAGVDALRQACKDVGAILERKAVSVDKSAPEDGVAALQDAFPGSEVISE